MRPSPPLPLPLLLLLTACSQGFGGDDGGAQDGGGTGDGGSLDGGAGDGGEVGGGLPDLGEDLGPGGCDELDGEAVAGAAAYFLGTYERGADGDWVGEERYVLYANPAWQDQGGADCVVTWTATAADGSTGACAACDVGLAVNAELDPAATTCPKGLYAGDEEFTVGYAVDLLSESRSEWFFAESGNAFGAGYALPDPDRMNFVTARSCQWFGG